MVRKNWWLLALCGVLDAIIAVIYVNHAGSGFASYGALVLVCRLAVAAGACTIAAGIWGSGEGRDRKSTRLNSSHLGMSYAVLCLQKKKKIYRLWGMQDERPRSGGWPCGTLVR